MCCDVGCFLSFGSVGGVKFSEFYEKETVLFFLTKHAFHRLFLTKSSVPSPKCLPTHILPLPMIHQAHTKGERRHTSHNNYHLPQPRDKILVRVLSQGRQNRTTQQSYKCTVQHRLIYGNSMRSVNCNCLVQE